FNMSDLPAHLKPHPKLTRLSKVECLLCTHYDLMLLLVLSALGSAGICSQPLAEYPGFADVGLEPCGFCGQDECITTLKFTKDENPRLSTNCPYHYEGMHYTEPVNTSKKVKCTNTPIHCSLCSPSATGVTQTIWKYNFHIHIAEAHTYDQSEDFLAQAQMISDAFVSKAEEVYMGIV
ncbi:hypothetical protein GG344DRAFT_59756, partial [Lentinula edodes]